MSLDLGTQGLRLDGAVRNPDREGAIAHLETERGFALVARASLAGTDVVDPTIWVKEKISVAMAGSGSEPALRTALAAVRSLHGEIMKRPERDRSWIAIHLLLFQGDDGVAIAAGDCPCYRYRDGVLAGLGRKDPGVSAVAPPGSLGSATQVKIEVVPLRPRPGDLYLLATRPLQEGELAALARSLDGARDPGAALRAALEGRSDAGRVALRIPVPGEMRRAETEAPTMEPPREDVEDTTPIEPETLAPDRGPEPEPPPGIAKPEREPEAERADAEPEREPAREPEGPTSVIEERAESAPLVIPALDAEAAGAAIGPEAPPVPEREDEGLIGHDAPEADAGSAEAPEAEAPSAPEAEAEGDVDDETEPESAAPPREPARRTLAAVGEDRPWYEPLALWGAGALAIIALALLVRAILPGILGSGDDRQPATGGGAPVAGRSAGALDIVSEPPGALVKLDGETVPGRTPLAGVAVDPGVHRIELDWGAGGSWRDTIEVAAGARLTLRPAIFGSIAFRASEEDRVLDVYIDGSYAGTTPLTLDKVTVGRHLVRFGGPGLTMTAQEVDVLRDVHVELVGNAGAPPAPGSLTVKSAILGDEGFEAGRGDPVWIDGVARGATPFTIDLPPGMHSVRVVRRGFPAQISVIEVKSGGEHFSNAEFGARSGEPLTFTPPASLSRSQPTPLSVELPESAADVEHALWLHAAAPGGSFQARAMTRLDQETNAHSALVPDEIMRNAANQVRVYFRATAPGGVERYTEIFTLPIRD